MPEVYTLTITEAQAQILSQACELLARTMAGQWREAYRLLPRDPKVKSSIIQEVENQIKTLMPRVLRDEIDGVHASFGIGSHEIGVNHNIAWDLYQVIRYRLAWDYAISQGYVKSLESERDWETMMGVIYDPPIQFGPERLAQIKREIKNTMS